MWKNSLKNVESDNNKIIYETLLDFLQRNGTYFLNKPGTYYKKLHFMCNKLHIYIYTPSTFIYIFIYIYIYMRFNRAKFQ